MLVRLSKWTKGLLTLMGNKAQKQAQISEYIYKPSPLLFHHSLQSIYEHISYMTNQLQVQYEREKIFFDDGGHVSLDWTNKVENLPQYDNVPIVFVMHGMTGGSQCTYMKVMAIMSQQKGYTSLCMNSRGFNSEMTSPIPFVGLHFHQLEKTIQRIQTYYPKRPIHMVGMSLGGNYVLRYLIQQWKNNTLNPNIRSLSLVGTPFDVKYVIHNMNKQYQKYFIKYYLDTVVLKHQKMRFWWDNGIIDLEHLKKSENLKEFHERITAKILGRPVNDIFDDMSVTPKDLENFPVKTLLITSKDDPMIPFESVPVDSIRKNKNINFCPTDKGAHMCWYEGWKPQRWYPKPIFHHIEKIQKAGIIHTE